MVIPCYSQSYSWERMIISVPSMRIFPDFFHFHWVYTIKSKDEVFGRYWEFKSLVENQSNKKIKCLGTNGRGEYIRYLFTHFSYLRESLGKEPFLHTPQWNETIVLHGDGSLHASLQENQTFIQGRDGCLHSPYH